MKSASSGRLSTTPGDWTSRRSLASVLVKQRMSRKLRASDAKKTSNERDDPKKKYGRHDPCAADPAASQASSVQGEFEEALHRLDTSSIVPSRGTYLSLIRLCKSFDHAKAVHGHLVSRRPDLLSSLAHLLVDSLVKHGAPGDAYRFMQSIRHRTAASWTALVSSYAQCGSFRKALQCYHLMVEDGFEANLQLFLFLLKACGRIPDLEEGKKLHHDARRKGLASNAFIGSSLLRMYAKCGSISCAEGVFQEMPDCNRDVVLWNAMLSVYADQGHDEKVLLLYRQMCEGNMKPDHTTFAIAIQACSSLAERECGNIIKEQPLKLVALEIGRAMHSEAARYKIASHVMVTSSLVRLYGRCGAIREAENAFSSTSDHNVVSWTTMFSAYTDQGIPDKALKLFVQMHEEGVSPDEQSFAVLLQACVAFAEKEEETLVDGQNVKALSLKLGQAMDSDAEMHGFTSNVFIGSALINMHAKCGNLIKAENVFDRLPLRDTVTWTAMLSAYLEQEQGDKALKLYKRMQKQNVVIDETTLACILKASGELGRLDVCRQVHFSIVSAGCDSSPFLCTCLVHAYGISSSTLDASGVFDNLHEPDAVAWNACISGYAREGDWGSSVKMLQCMQMTGTRPNQVSFLSILFVCSHAGIVDTAFECFGTMIRDWEILSDGKHYIIIMDLLARMGDFAKVKDIMRKMQIQDCVPLQTSLLGACFKHRNMELGEQVFDFTKQLQPQAYILMSNIYANASLHGR